MKEKKLIFSIIIILFFHLFGCEESEDFQNSSQDNVEAEEILAADICQLLHKSNIIFGEITDDDLQSNIFSKFYFRKLDR